MVTRIELLVDDLGPSQEGFDAALPDLLERAKALPAVQRIESGAVWPREDGSAAPSWRTLVLYFPSYEEASAATASPEGYRFFREVYRLAAERVTELFTDVTDVL